MASAKLKQAPKRHSRNSLNRDIIIDAALELAKADTDISIRSVAGQLGCSHMALYRHFPDKRDLLMALLDRVIGSIDLPDDQQAWNVRLLNIAKEHLRVLQNNAWSIPLLFQYPDPGPAVRRVGEKMFVALKEGGASNDLAVNIFSSILALNYGWAGFTTMNSGLSGGQNLSKKLSNMPDPDDSLPVTSELWSEFGNLGSNQHHEAALVRLISNLNSPR